MGVCLPIKKSHIAKPFSKAVLPVFTPIINVEESGFSISYPKVSILSLFNFNHFLCGCEMTFITVLICISLTSNDVEYFFIYPLIIDQSSFVKCLLKTFAH